MSSKNFMAYGDAETVLTGFANAIKGKAKTYILNTGSTDISSTTMIPLVDINDFPDCNVGDIIVLKVNANYTFNKNAGGYWTFKINNIGYEMRLLWADESNFNQDLPKGSCVVFVYNHNMLFDDYLTVASLDVKNFDPSTVVKKSQTAGLLKNDGTVDTTTYASEAGTESLINSTVGWTGKNQFDYARATCSGSEKTFPCVINGLTFTKNADSSITVTGEASATTQLFLWVNNTIPAGNYTISGCPSGGATNKYDLRDGSAHIETGDGYDVNIASDVHAGDAYYLIITIYNGYAITGSLLFRPMIRDARITDPTYEPYHKSVEECKADNTVIAPVESGTTASQAYAQGAHFIKDGAFCTAITSIASGATLTKNTNYTEGDVASALSSGGGGEVYPAVGTEAKIGTWAGYDLYRQVFQATSATASSNVTMGTLPFDYYPVVIQGYYRTSGGTLTALPVYGYISNAFKSTYVTAVKNSTDNIINVAVSNNQFGNGLEYTVIVDYLKSAPIS